MDGRSSPSAVIAQRTRAQMQQGLLANAIEMLKTPPNERTQERIHLCAVLLTDHLRAFPAIVPYNLLCDACRSLTYSQLAPRVRFTDSDDSGTNVLRVLLSGSVLVQRKFGPKAWLPTGFLRTGDILGLPGMLMPAGDDIRYTTMGDAVTGGVEFAVLRRFEFERCLRSTYEKAIGDNVRLLQSTPSFSSLPEATLKQLASCSRLVTLGPGELLTRQGEATDELFILKSGVVRLVKTLRTTETFRWPTDKRPQALSHVTQTELARLSPRKSLGGESGLPGLRPSVPRRDSTRAHVDNISRRGSTRAQQHAAMADGCESDDESDDSDGSSSERGGPGRAELSDELHREVSEIRRNRMVMVGEVREGTTFARDEAIAVIKRIAGARANRSSASAYRELPPIRRNVTSFCMTAVQAIAMSPVALIIFVQPDLLPGFIRSFGPSRDQSELDKELRRQREWKKYKAELLYAATNKVPSRLQETIGPRRYKSISLDASENADLKPPGSSAAPPLGSPRSGAASARAGSARDSRWKFLDGLDRTVNGAASAELAAASGDMGTTITEQFTITHRLEPTRKKPSAETPSVAPVDTSVLASALKHHAVAGVVVGAE